MAGAVAVCAGAAALSVEAGAVTVVSVDAVVLLVDGEQASQAIANAVETSLIKIAVLLRARECYTKEGGKK